MLTRAELGDYLGLSWSTLKHVLTVPPVDLGTSVIRYRRDQIDDWVKSRPPRLGRAAPAPVVPPVERLVPDTRLRAVGPGFQPGAQAPAAVPALAARPEAEASSGITPIAPLPTPRVFDAAPAMAVPSAD